MKVRILSYLLFFFLCLALGLVYRFPESIARQWIQDHLAAVDGAVVTLENFSPALPAGFKADRLMVAGRGFPGLAIGELRVQPALGRLAKGGLTMAFGARLHGGGLSGRIARAKGNKDRLIMEARLDQVAPPMELGRALGLLAGNWSGDFTLELDREQLRLTRGKWRLNQGELTLPPPGGGIGRIQFSRGRLDLSADKEGAMAVETLSLSGPHLDLNLTGRVIPALPMGATRLDLRGQLNLHPLYFMEGGRMAPLGLSGTRGKGRPVDVVVTGTIDRPKISPAEEG